MISSCKEGPIPSLQKRELSITQRDEDLKAKHQRLDQSPANMSASEFIFISEIPNQFSPLTLMSDIGNTYAKMTYFDSPDFKGNRQAFVFYPEAEPEQWAAVTEKLRSRDALKVSYVWYPEGNDDYVEKIPDGVEVLPYVYIENLPKTIDFHQIIAGLPHVVNMRFMDVPYKDDKWAFIYLGPKVDRQLRRNLIMGLRSKNFNGYPVYASELMATSAPVFPNGVQELPVQPQIDVKEMAPVVAPFRSEFLFLSNVPQPLGHGKILYFIKSSGIKLARVFFIETVDHLKRGFLHLPSLSEEEWADAVAKLRSHYFHVSGLPDGCGSRIDVDEVWFQPHGAPAPVDMKATFRLTDYYFLYNIPRGVSEQLLVHGCGFNRVRIQLFDPTTSEPRPTRIGFAVRLSSAPDRQSVEEALSSIRGKRFGESAVFVDRIWRSLRPQHQDLRLRLSLSLPSPEGEAEEGVEEKKVSPVPMEICSLPAAPTAQLVKVPLFFVHGLPSAYEDSALLEDVSVARSAGLSKSLSDTRCLFVQPTYADRHSWSCALAALYLRNVTERLGAEVNEVFREDGGFIGAMPEGMVHSCFLLVSNLPLDVDEASVLDEVSFIEESAFLLPAASTEKSLVVLMSSSNEEDQRNVVLSLQSKNFGGRRPAVQRLWLGSVELHGLWPSYRAPCQGDRAAEELEGRVQPMEDVEEEEEERVEEIDEEEKLYTLDDYDVMSAGDCSNGRLLPPAPSCVVIEGLPLMLNDKTVGDILTGQLDEARHVFCVLTSPSALTNGQEQCRFIVFAASQAEAQSTLRELGPPLKKHYRHRTLLMRVHAPENRDELIPVSDEFALRARSTAILVYGFPRHTLQSVRSQLLEAVDPTLCHVDPKISSAKRFLGHVVVSCTDWRACHDTYKVLRSVKFGFADVKVKFLAKL